MVKPGVKLGCGLSGSKDPKPRITQFGKLQEHKLLQAFLSSGIEMIGVVITFDDAENKAWLTVPEPSLEQFIGHEASFQFSKTKDFKGKVIAIETDFLVIKFDETPLGLGQGSQVTVAD